MIRTELGKITHARFGFGGYQDAMIGFTLTFAGKSWGVCAPFVGAWAREPDEHCKWTVADQDQQFAAAVRLLGETLRKARKQHVQELVGVPVEVTFDGNVISSWRVLEEVL